MPLRMARHIAAAVTVTLYLAACGEEKTASGPPADPALIAAGQIAFQRYCVTCHNANARRHGTGPYLVDLERRKAGTLSGFDYSEAMKGSGITWTAEALDTFLANPDATVPSSMMVIEPIRDPAERAALIAYLLAP